MSADHSNQRAIEQFVALTAAIVQLRAMVRDYGSHERLCILQEAERAALFTI